MAAMMDHDDVPEGSYVDGGQDARIKILAFLEKVGRNPEVDGEVTLQLCQHGGAQEEVIYECTFEPSGAEGPGAIADELVERAEEDCEGLSAKKMKYTVKADGINGRATFTLKYVQPEEEDLEDVEDLPNRSGIIRQTMRHLESMAKIVVTVTKNAQADSREMVAEARRRSEEDRKRLAELEAHSLENRKAYEELINGTFARNLEIRKLENAERRKDQVASILMQGAPLLVSKFLGGGTAAANAPPPTPGQRTPLEHMLEGFMQTLDQEQMAAIQSIFKPEQILGLMEMFRYVMERREAEERARTGAPPPSENKTEPSKE